MLKQRVLTAAVALPLAIALLVYGSSYVVAAFFTVAVALCTYEVASMLQPKLEAAFAEASDLDAVETRGGAWTVWWSVLIAAGTFVFVSLDTLGAGVGVAVFGLLSCFLVGAFFAPDNSVAFGRITTLVISIIYGSFPWLSIWELYTFGEGPRFLFMLVAIVWFGDTGAYFGGKRFGRQKLAPRMSPNKTKEGALCGLISSGLGGVLINLIYGGELGGYGLVLAVSLLGGACGQMGDLVESTLKRFAGVKDSGFIFPGHGGILDRVDGVIFAAPVIWFVLYISSLLA